MQALEAGLDRLVPLQLTPQRLRKWFLMYSFLCLWLTPLFTVSGARRFEADAQTPPVSPYQRPVMEQDAYEYLDEVRVPQLHSFSLELLMPGSA